KGKKTTRPLPSRISPDLAPDLASADPDLAPDLASADPDLAPGGPFLHSFSHGPQSLPPPQPSHAVGAAAVPIAASAFSRRRRRRSPYRRRRASPTAPLLRRNRYSGILSGLACRGEGLGRDNGKPC
uniref:Uncharacterized protein n=1 Tax=Triticum urartu TaxID=4572 RepID=A0A8R7K4K0_TRIUA